MDNQTVDNILKTTLQSLGEPVARLLYDGESDTYIVFQLVIGQEVGHSDDDNGGVEYIYQIHIYSKSDYIDLLRRTVKALKAAGFYNVVVNAEIYEKETGFYHIPLEVNYLEVCENGNDWTS